MSTTSESRVEADAAPARAKVLVWDAPVRIFHWLMVISFAGAWLTAESDRWHLVHVTLGFTMAGLLAFRIVWGLVGPRHARFSSFVRGPSAAARYLANALRGRPDHHTGHNPAGAIAIVALLLLAFAVTATGWANYADLGGRWLGKTHEAIASVMLAVVGIHVAGVLVGSWLHRENLVRAMITGRKAAPPHEATRRAWRSVAAVMVLAVLGFWTFQWQQAPGGFELTQAAPGTQHRHAERDHDRDDD
jgi:cytochrome b